MAPDSESALRHCAGRRTKDILKRILAIRFVTNEKVTKAREKYIITPNVIRTIILRRITRGSHKTYTGNVKCIENFGQETWIKQTSCESKAYIEVNIKLDIL